MAMSRRKQLHPKSLKEGDETIFVLPDELKCDEETHEIIARIDIEQGHRLGPFPAIAVSCQQQRLSTDSDSMNGSSSGGGSSMIMQIDNEINEHHIQSFQLLDNKHNWLARCSILNHSSTNFDINFQDDQIFIILTQSITTGTRLCTNIVILPKLINTEDCQIKQEIKINMNSITDDIKVKEEPIESEEEQQPQQQQLDLSSSSNIKSESPIISNNSTKSKETKKLHPLIFICDDCGIRYSNRSTLDAHRQHYCIKRGETKKSHSTDSTMIVKTKSMKRKHIDTSDSSSSPTKRLSTPSNDSYCSECDILFSKPDNLLQHKLYYCRTKSTSLTSTSSSLRQINEQNISNSFRPPIPFDRPIQIGQFIYVPVPIVSSQVENTEQALSPSTNDNKPLDLSKPKKIVDECEKSTSPLDLTIEKPTNLFNLLNSSTITKSTNHVQQQIYECDYCSIRFSSLKTLHAHQENYCIEYRKQKKPTNNNNLSINETNSIVNDSNRSQSPPISISKTVPLSPNDTTISSTHLPPHRSSPFMCRLCKYRGNTLRGMRMHFKFHLSNNEPCTDDDIIITPTINNNSLSIPTSQLLLKCKICSAMFDQEDTLLNHIKYVHTKESLLECLECQSRFCSKWNLLRHMKLTHTNIKCDEEEQQQQQQDADDNNELNESHFHMNESKIDQKLDEDLDLSSSSTTSSTNNEKLSDPVNLTRNVLIESMDINSIKKISDGFSIKKKFACPYCHIKFGSIDTLKQHMTKYCSSRPTNDEQLNTKKKTPETYCSSCQIPFRHKSSYDAHKMYYCRGSNKAHVKIQG
ncbi:unnamed protein product [Adineta steineri]|uniref:C2H2-type domain-containing protein n=2 Tax=Adineta steineri TaxID=433720 RepID=A0A818L214_9BILA|nr:unnamed protein product [Adineta steineri]CAF3559742.1 unnamed protein product [Adineta steineri]